MKKSSFFSRRISQHLSQSHYQSELNKPEMQEYSPSRKPYLSALLAVGVFIPLIAFTCYSTQPDASEAGFNEILNTPILSGTPQIHTVNTADSVNTPISLPTKNPHWHDCRVEEAQTYNTKPISTNFHLDCGAVQVPLDPITHPQGQTISIAIMKLSLDNTPHNAPPVFFTTGAYTGSLEALTHLASNGRGTQVLSHFPLIAIDRRGIGDSGSFMCVDPTVTQVLNDLGKPKENLVHRAESVISASQRSYADCDNKPGINLESYNFQNATHDIDSVRQALGMDKIAIDARSDGAILAYYYAMKYPTHLVRLIIDSPSNFAKGAVSRFEDEAQAFQDALDSYQQICLRNSSCALHDSPREKFSQLLKLAYTGHLPGLSDASILSAMQVLMAISPLTPQELTLQVAGDINQALQGNDRTLVKLTKWSNAEFNTGGEVFARCAIDVPRLSQSQAMSLINNWRRRFPGTGAVTALKALTCNGWPGIEKIPTMTHLSIPVLLLYGQHDPLIGSGSISAIKNQFTDSHTAYQSVEWDNFGHGVLIHSTCAAQPIVTYIETGQLPHQRIVCTT